MRVSLNVALIGGLATLVVSSSASAAFQLTNFGAGSIAPLEVAGDAAGNTLLAGSSEWEIVTGGGFKNAFQWFVPRSMAQQMVDNPIFEMPRRNTPVVGPNPNSFINTFLVLNSDANGRGGYIVDIAPVFLNPGAANSDVFTVDLSAQADVWASLNAYASDAPGTGGSYVVFHVVQQSADGSDGAQIAYGDLSFRAIPEPASLGLIAAAGLLALRRR
jgi:hypothetical protein